MIVIEIDQGNLTLTERDELTDEAIREYVGGQIEGASVAADEDAQSLIVYCNADGYSRHELAENFRLANGRTVYGPALIVGIGPGGTNRGLTPDEIEALAFEQIETSHLPILRYRSQA